jgi:RNA polymerase primary sigma factor
MNETQKYLEEIRKLPDFRTDPGGTAELVRRISLDGDQDAQFRLIESTLRLISELTSGHCNRWNVWQNYQDLFQEANCEVATKISRYDPDKSSWEDFVGFRSRVAFIRFWYRAQPVRVTEHGRKFRRLLKQIHVVLSERLGRDPTIEEVSGHLEIAKEKVLDFQNNSTLVFSELDGFYEASDSSRRPEIDELPSREKDPQQLSEIAEVNELLIGSIGKTNADILLTHERFGTEAARDLYLALTGKRVSAENMRQLAHRFKIKAIKDIQNKIRHCA